MKEYIVNFIWDTESYVWIATSDDVPGLVLESGSFDALLERVRITIPELLKLNGLLQSNATIVYHTDLHERIQQYG